MRTILKGAKAILSQEIAETDVAVEDGFIVEVGTELSGNRYFDGRGKVLGPSMIDAHGDAFERQLMPRAGVFAPMDTALLDTDRQLAANGITTAYFSVTMGWEPGLRSVERCRAFLRAVEDLQPRMTIDARIQIRWETFAFEALPLIEEALQASTMPSLAFNDHVSENLAAAPFTRNYFPFPYGSDFLAAPVREAEIIGLQKKVDRTGLTKEEYLDLMERVAARRPEVATRITRIAELARDKGCPMFSHDDTVQETRDFYRDLGVRIAEFPKRTEVAESAREAGDLILFGAPNVTRGGSHVGAPNAGDMVEQGLCDILASDYFYPALLAAVHRLVKEKRTDLATAWGLVSSGPAKAMGLLDRGTIEPGKRADLVLIDWPDAGSPSVNLTLNGGRVVYWAEGHA